MLYQLLLTGMMQWKHKKMVLTGPPDSGKMSWLGPILAVIDRHHLTTCTDETKFSCQMINEHVEYFHQDEKNLCGYDITQVFHAVSVRLFYYRKTPQYGDHDVTYSTLSPASCGCFLLSMISPKLGSTYFSHGLTQKQKMTKHQTFVNHACGKPLSKEIHQFALML